MVKIVTLYDAVQLPCGVRLKNRLVKSAMSDSLGDGAGHPTHEQSRLYRRWADGGIAASIIGEVQGDHRYAEKPGNLVLDQNADLSRFSALAQAGRVDQSQVWLQLGHAGALSYAPISIPKGPSALDLPGLTCAELSVEEIEQLPQLFAKTAGFAQQAGFGGVQIHAAHGFLLSQFLSPLFNKRRDQYGGAIDNRMRVLLAVIAATRAAVGPAFPIAIKLNASDQLEGGLDEQDALRVVAALDRTSVDLIDISGGTYFPGAKAASDGAGRGPYFLEFASQARLRTGKPLMLTGGFKTRAQAQEAIETGAVDIVGMARLLALVPDLPRLWAKDEQMAPAFPTFENPPVGGVTAWYTMRLTEIAAGQEPTSHVDLEQAMLDYDARDQDREQIWNGHFGAQSSV